MTLHPDIERVALLKWHLYPASSRSKAACFKAATDAATCDLDILERWSAAYPGCNWRVVVGPSQLWGIDCDVPSPDHDHDGVAALAALVKVHGPLPPRPTTRSGGGGCAIFFRHNGEPIVGQTGIPAPGLDPRRGRLSVTIPPSIHITTRQPYRWLQAPWNLAPPVAPSWLLRLVAPAPEPDVPSIPVISTTDRARRRLHRAIDTVMQAAQGKRNQTLNGETYAVARHVAAGSIGEHEAIEALYAAARQAGLSHPEARATIRSGFSAGLRRL